jgi:4-carboxymuconolactone decarboxylase
MPDIIGEPRLPFPQIDEVSGEQRAAFEQIMTSRNVTVMPNIFSALGNSVGALQTVGAVGEYIRFRTEFDDRLRELCILTVAQEARCVLEWTGHVRIARGFGVDDAEIALVGSAEAEALPSPTGPALRYVRLVANNEPVDDPTADTLRATFGDRGLVDLTILAGYYSMLARFINTMRVPPSTEPVPFARDA